MTTPTLSDAAINELEPTLRAYHAGHLTAAGLRHAVTAAAARHGFDGAVVADWVIDGERATHDVRAEIPTQAPPPFATAVTDAAAPKVDNSVAWTLAFAPLIIVLIDGLIIAAGAASNLATLSFAAAAVLNTVLALGDRARLRRAGVHIGIGWAIFLVPIYLFKRAAILRQSLAIPLVWCVCLVGSFVGDAVIPTAVGVPIDTGLVQQTITGQATQQLGETVTVECPSSVTVRVGSSFDCTIADSSGSTAIAVVTVQNRAGDIVWRIAH